MCINKMSKTELIFFLRLKDLHKLNHDDPGRKRLAHDTVTLLVTTRVAGLDRLQLLWTAGTPAGWQIQMAR